jgi:hypothetical protein
MNSRQRWGTFAITDHLRRQPFVAEVLLYDRLVIPYPADELVASQWRDRGWRPGLLQQYLEVLGDLAIIVKWDHVDDDAILRRMTPLTDPNDWARFLLATKWLPDKPREVSEVRAVAAYPSRQACRRETKFVVSTSDSPWVDEAASSNPPAETQQQRLERLGFLLRYNFLVPADEDDEHTQTSGAHARGVKQLEAAVKLSRDKEFQEQRLNVHKWQEEVISRGMADEDAITEMRSAVKQYSEYMEKNVRKGRWKFAYMAITAGLATGLGLGALVFPPLGIPVVVAPLMGLAQFIVFERSDPPGPGQSAVGAMFYESRRALSPTNP